MTKRPAKVITTICACALVAGIVTLSLSLTTGAVPVLASSGRNGALHVTKECSTYIGQAAGYCTVTHSNLPEIPAGAKVFYTQDQTANAAAGFLDTDVVLYAGPGNRAAGHCTLDWNTNVGLCTFSDGTGRLAGFSARVDVTPFPPPDAVDYHWDGTFSFNPEPGR
jgi:hypothetical protein